MRNYASHHASIWKRQDLRDEYGRVIETLSWLSPALLATVSVVDRFPDLHHGGPLMYREQIQRLADSFGA